jgi:hypothetical protein
MLKLVLKQNQIRIEEERFALRRDGSVLFGVLQLAYGVTSDGRAALGLRTANNKTMSIQLCAGLVLRTRAGYQLALFVASIKIPFHVSSGSEALARLWQIFSILSSLMFMTAKATLNLCANESVSRLFVISAFMRPLDKDVN